MTIDISKLGDHEIHKIFKDDNISDVDKKYILEHNCERIKKLPISIFRECMEYANVEILSKNYNDKITALSYDDLISLIYEGLCDIECLLHVIKMPTFQKYLEQEKQNKKNVKLQIFELTSKIYLYSDSIENLTLIGKDINQLIHYVKQDPENIKELVESYFSAIIEHMDKIDLNSEIMNECINMLCLILKSNIKLDYEMIKFYTLFRIKNLDLTEYCKEVSIRADENPSVFGDYQTSAGTLRIFKNYLENVFDTIFKEFGINDFAIINRFLNLQMLQCISHELGHVMRDKKCNYNKKDLYKNFNTNPYLNYTYKNGMLHNIIGDKKYQENHGKFISENQADLFAIFDIDKIMNSYFKGIFPDDELQLMTQINCKKIVNFYIIQTEDRVEIIPPTQKFDAFFNQTIPEQIKNTIPDISINNLSIMDRLLFGADVPKQLLKKFFEVAKKQLLITNLYAYIEPTIKQIENGYKEKKTMI